MLGLELDTQTITERLKGLIEGAETGVERGEVAKMLRELACMGHEPLIEAAQGLLKEEGLWLHLELESGLKRVCSGRGLEQSSSSERFMVVEEEHLLSQLRELMRSLALDRPMKVLGELAQLREELWSGAIMSWLERVEAGLPRGGLKRERGLLLECSDQLGHLLEYDPFRFGDEGINILAERLQRMEHGGGELTVILPSESDDAGWEALRGSGLLSDLRGVARLVLDGYGSLSLLESEGAQGLEVVKELDLLILTDDELARLGESPLLEQVRAGVSTRPARGPLCEALKERLEGASGEVIGVAERCCSAIERRVGEVVFRERVIPSGSFWMTYDGDREAEWVKVGAHFMMETQVTQALYEAVIGKNPSHFKGTQRPVEKVSWEDGVKFANGLSQKLGLTPAYEGSDNEARFNEGVNGFRLPFDAEWEFAARGGQGFKYAGSDNLSEVGWYWDNSGDSTHDVAQLKPNGYGLYDMSGNVWEWCVDDYNNPGQYRPGAGERVFRGGGWNFSAYYCTVADRFGNSPVDRRYDLGLRLSRSLDPLDP